MKIQFKNEMMKTHKQNYVFAMNAPSAIIFFFEEAQNGK